MLTALRRLAETWVAKALFVLLVLSFAVWGIGDTVRNWGRDTSVARVNGDPISVEEAQRAVRREMQRLARTVGAAFENDPRIRRAVAEQGVESLVLDRVVRAEAERMRVVVPDAAVRDFVFGLPAFRGPDGTFARPLFDSFLRANELTEPQLLALVRSDVARQQISNAVRAGATGPDVLTRPLLRWQAEQRAAEVVALRIADAPEPPAPDEAALRRFHENNPERFSTPELREATVAVLTADLITREVEVSDADVAAAYEQRRDQYQAGERRVIEQALLQEEDKAREVAAAWRRGADFAAITAQAGAAGGLAVELGALDRGGLPLPELAEAAFALPAGGVSDPVRSPFGWHVLHVVRVEPPTSRPLEQVREELRAELAAEKAADLAFERANRVEDALAGGATLEEVARRFNLGLATVRTDAEGHDAAGNAVELPVIEASRAPLLRAVFAAERGAPPQLRETEAGFVAVEVKEVIPPALRPFEGVADAVRSAWAADARRRAQETRAAALLAATGTGKTLAQAAQEAGLGARQVGALTRDMRGEQAPVPADVLPRLFRAALNEVTMAETPEGFVVAQVLEITPGDPDTDPLGLGRVREAVEQSMATDIEVQFMAALRARAEVRVNPRAVDALAQP